MRNKTNNILVYKRKYHPWLKIFEDSKISFLVLDSKNDKKLMALLQVQPNWNIESEDEEFASFIRNDVVVENSSFLTLFEQKEYGLTGLVKIGYNIV